MNRIVFFCLSFLFVSVLKSQDIDKGTALQLVAKNSAALGLSKDALNNSIVTNAYFNKISGTQIVYLQQAYKGLPILNQIQTLAFKNGQLVSKTGERIPGLAERSNNVTGTPLITPETAVRTAFNNKKIKTEEGIVPKSVTGAKKFEFGKLGSSSENVTAELMWVPVKEGRDLTLKLAWQVFFAPKTSPDMWLLRIDAERNELIDEQNLTVYCNWDKESSHDHADDYLPVSNKNTNSFSSEQAPLSPLIVNGASYRVIPFPAESPLHPGGSHALVSDPWTITAGNATTLKWHSDGTSDYTYTRGNNVWAYHDRAKQNVPDVTRSATSTTSPDPLTFNFTPDFSVVPSQTSPVQNQQFNITNLFYWNNIVHDIMYQYGFDEPSGNYQANNLGRGGVGNDYVRAEAQDGGGVNNANFSSTPDGTSGRMQMYLFDGPSKGVTVNSPAAIAGTYPSVEGDMSSNNRLSLLGPVTGQLIYYNDDLTNTTFEACAAPTNTITGKIVLINRGTCSFAIKVKNAQTAGAIGVIVINNVATAPITMGGTDNTITIPAVMISQANGAIMVAQLSNNVNVTLNPPLDWDGDVDNGVIVHEYAHGISNRLTGGPSQASCLGNAEQMGEGWSDYYSLMLTQNWETSNVNTGFTSSRAIGTYANGEAPNGAGFRTKKYSTNFSINNLVYAASIPSQVHDRGEIWCAALWDMTWNIIQQVNSITPKIYTASGTGGNVIALKLVTEAMKLQPCSPGFIDGRDAILKADQLLYGGQFSCAIREAFRRRGMGAFASQGSSNDVNDQTPDFSSYLTLSLTQNVTQIPEGQNIVYTNKVVSCGPINNFLLTDTLPLNVTYVSGGSYNTATRVVSFPVNFAGAGSQNYVFTVNVNNGSYYSPTTYLDEPVPAATFPPTLTQASTPPSVWSVSSAQSHTAPYSMFTPDAVGISEQILTTTNGITLGANQSALSFWHSYSTEVGFDGGVIEISTDNGTSWSDLGNQTTLGYYNSLIDATNAIPISGKRAYTGTSNGFIKTSVDLSGYAGQTAKFRWAFYSDPFEGGVGWFVDDILVKNEAVVNMRTSLLNGSGTRVGLSDTVTLILQTLVCSNAAVTTAPSNTTVCSGSNASFTVTATGSTLNYQWQLSTDGGATYTNIGGATSATLNLPAVTAGMNNNMYKVIVSNTCPSSVTSSAATLTVTTPAVISTQPASITVCTGENATFTVTATGTNLTYQWEVSTNGGVSWTSVPGATSATLVLSGVTTTLNNNQYRVKLSSCVAGGLTSAAATLSVNTAAGITSQPISSTVCAGSNASFSVAATGTALNFQWQVSTNGGSNYTDIAGATAATLNLTAVTAAMNGNQYRVVLSNACPSGVTSSSAVLSVNDVPVITSQPVNVTVCGGSNATFSLTATGSNLAYQWQVSTDAGVTWGNIAGATSSGLTLNAVTSSLNNNRYRVVLPSCVPGGLNSNAATLTVNTPVTITTQPSNTVACSGNNVTFTSVAAGSGVTSQWQISTDAGTSWSNISGATGSSLTLSAVTAAMNANSYRVILNGTCTPGTVTSGVATLTINNTVTISQQPVNSTLCAGLNTTFSANASGSGLNYQWQVSTNGGTSFTNIAGANSSTLNLTSVTAVMNANQYRVALNGDCVSNLFTNAATLTVNNSVTIVTQPSNQVGCDPVPATFSVNATGNTLTYQWEISTNAGSNWTSIAGATNNTLTIPSLIPALNGNQYRVRVAGGPCGTLTSNAATLSVGQLPAVAITASSTTVSPGGSATLTATPNPAGNYTYQWFRDNVPVAGANTNTLAVNIGNLGIYKAIANSSNGCSNVSNELAITGATSTRLTIYPNPNFGLFQVRMYSDMVFESARTINVFDARGAKILTKIYTILTPSDRMEVDISREAAGVYYIELFDGSGKRIGSGGITKF